MRNNMDDMRELYNSMSDGEKQYLANKLYKEDRVVAQKVREYVPSEMLEKPHGLKVGDIVECVKDHEAANDLREGCFYVVTIVDPTDEYLPIGVAAGGQLEVWAKASQLEKVGTLLPKPTHGNVT